ncbi:hypothetical protein SUGI_0440180 [Cryptomeria japonica]|nr:hypothetical protein SUGI_0440180 [Cryptomeria japonica]
MPDPCSNCFNFSSKVGGGLLNITSLSFCPFLVFLVNTAVLGLGFVITTFPFFFDVSVSSSDSSYDSSVLAAFLLVLVMAFGSLFSSSNLALASS